MPQSFSYHSTVHVLLLTGWHDGRLQVQNTDTNQSITMLFKYRHLPSPFWFDDFSLYNIMTAVDLKHLSDIVVSPLDLISFCSHAVLF